MMKVSIIYLFLGLLVFFLPNTAWAIEDPLKLPNNKFGIHILFPSELENAAKLVNSGNGDWGYVVIPIQATDRDLLKWQAFMTQARLLHVIPIIRLATDGDYFNTKAWRRPTYDDMLDFANFLDSLDWPVKNRYISVYNEVNRADEWGGGVNPDEYAHLLSYGATVFKAKNEDFFILSAGLDNAAPNQGSEYMNEYSYMQAMERAVPGIFSQIDGLSSHSYPNPGFALPPESKTPTSISSFMYEKQLAESFAHKTLPIFITETGWTASAVSEDIRSMYYKTAFTNVWNDPGIVVVAPFLLQGSGSVFEQFTFLSPSHTETKQYLAIKEMSKPKGTPSLGKSSTGVLGLSDGNNLKTQSFRLKEYDKHFSPSSAASNLFHWIMKL